MYIEKNCTSTYSFFKEGQPDDWCTALDGDEDCAAVLAYCKEMAFEDDEGDTSGISGQLSNSKCIKPREYRFDLSCNVEAQCLCEWAPGGLFTTSRYNKTRQYMRDDTLYDDCDWGWIKNYFGLDEMFWPVLTSIIALVFCGITIVVGAIRGHFQCCGLDVNNRNPWDILLIGHVVVGGLLVLITIVCVAISPVFSNTWFVAQVAGVLSAPIILFVLLPTHITSTYRIAWVSMIVFLLEIAFYVSLFITFTFNNGRKSREHLELAQSSSSVNDYWGSMAICSLAISLWLGHGVRKFRYLREQESRLEMDDSPTVFLLERLLRANGYYLIISAVLVVFFCFSWTIDGAFNNLERKYILYWCLVLGFVRFVCGFVLVKKTWRRWARAKYFFFAFGGRLTEVGAIEMAGEEITMLESYSMDQREHFNVASSVSPLSFSFELPQARATTEDALREENAQL